MSGVIPMVSSSPPPFEDESGDVEDDNFGGFTSAPPSIVDHSDKYGDFGAFTTIMKTAENNTNLEVGETADGAKDHEWADFDEFGEGGSSPDHVTNDISNDTASTPTLSDVQADCSCSKPTNLNLVRNPLNEVDNVAVENSGSSAHHANSSNTETVSRLPVESPSSDDLQVQMGHAYKTHKPDSQDNTSQGSMTDSGMCSDISPVPKFDEYPDFVEHRLDLDLTDDHSDQCDSRRTNNKEVSPGFGEAQCRDSDSGHGIEFSEISLSKHSAVSPEEDPDPDISPNEETLVTDSISDLQLPEQLSDSSLDHAVVETEEPAPLDLKLSAYTGDEEEPESCDINQCIDDSQFPSASISVEDVAASGKNSTDDSEKRSNSSEQGDADDCEWKSASSGPCDESSGPASGEAFQKMNLETESTKDPGSSAQHSNDEDDDFGGFADFASPPSVDMPADEESTDDWAAFGSPGADAETSADTGDGWAAFQEQPQLAADVGEDDFGDFESDCKTESQGITLVTETAEQRLERALGGCFLGGKSSDRKKSLAVQLLLDELEVEVPRIQEVEHPSPKHIGFGLPSRQKEQKSTTIDINVWNNLKDMERSIGLKYHWPKSTGSHRLLQALGIDTRNMLKNKRPAVPIFASQLGLLEPSKDVTANTSEHEAQSVIVDTSKPVLPATTPQDIPPAQFDWSSSGLTNPLDASSSVPLDLDFFVKNETASHSSNASQSEVLKKEKEILQALEPTSRAAVPRTLEPLENLLATMKYTATTPSGRRDLCEDNLSKEARLLADKIEDLSFMRASVLMFPVKDSDW